MLFELIATISLGAGVAGLMLGIQKILGGRVPRWVIPACAGLVMLGYTLWSEYSWYGRTSAALDGKIVAEKIDSQQFWRPWTYIAPVSTRFIALDKAGATTVDATVLTEIYLVARWQDVPVVPVAFDCLLGRRADWIDAGAEDLTAKLEGADWRSLDQANPVLRTACDKIR